MIKKLHLFILILSGLLLSHAATAQQGSTKTVTGIVVGEDQKPLPGVVVTTPDNRVGAVTSSAGSFSITVPGNVRELRFSMLGYTSQSVSIHARTTLEVEMKEDDIKLDEVIVIGYGTASKSDFTGAVGTVRLNDLTKAPVGSFTDALAGRLAGVQVSTADGQPGSQANVVIRGASSLTQSNSPLYVVDRIPIESFDAASISSEEIQSISVLKDASAIAIYGARAANGVIVITTKKGQSGRTIVDLSIKTGFPRITNTIEMMDAYEYVRYLEEMDENKARRLYYNNGKTLEDYRNVNSIDWQDKILSKNPLTQIYDLSLYGGTNTTRFRVSGSYYDQDGVIENSGYRSFRGRVSLDQDIGSKITMNLNVTGSNNEDHGQLVSSEGINTTTLTNLLYRVWGYRPYSPNSDLMEEFVDDDMITNNDFRINPVLSNVNEYRKQLRKDSRISLSLEYRPSKDFTLLITGASGSRNQNTRQFHNSQTVEGSPYNTRNTKGQWGSVNHFNRTVLTNENTLSYNKTIDRHQIDAVVGLSFEKGKTQSSGFTAINVPNEELGIDGLGTGIPFSNSYSAGEYTMASYYGRANYSWDSKYLFTVTMRADGSSKFAPGNRWGYFPSGAVAWNVGQEEFLKNVSQISSLKLRTSYGITGNNRIGNYDYISTMDTGIDNYYSFGNATPSVGVGISRLYNPDLKWETTAQFDVGLEVALWGGRLRIEADYYNKRTSNLLLNSQIPANTGFTSAMQNVGKIENKGLEFTLETVNIRTNRVLWTSNFNISFNRNKVVRLNNDAPNRLELPRFTTMYNNTPLWITAVGKPIGLFYGFVFDGVYQYEDFMDLTDGRYVLKQGIPDNGSLVTPGDIKYRDINGDGTIDDYDRVVIGNPNPVHTGGFSNTVTYESPKWGAVSLNVFLQWSYGNDVFNANRMLFEGNGGASVGLNQYASYANRWTPDNPSNTLFKTKGAGPQAFISDRTLEDGSFLRLKTVELSYTLPQRIVRKLGIIRSITLNAAAQNLLTFTGYKGLDPEVSTMNNVLTPGFDFCAYPRARVITFGCRIRL